MRSILLFAFLAGCTPSGLSGPLDDRFAPSPTETAFGSTPRTGEGVVAWQVAEDTFWEIPYEVRGGVGIASGDIVLGDADHLQERSAINGYRSARWYDCTVPYTIDPEAPSWVRSRFEDAAEHFEQRTALRFVEDDSAASRLRVVHGDGCHSQIGRTGGEQELSLGPGCENAAIHEIGHAVGLWHEQSRSDAREHIRLQLENVPEKWHFAFETYVDRHRSGEDVGPYDFGSVMHYSAGAFSNSVCSPSNPSGCSITDLDGQWIDVGQRYELSDGDIAGVAELYGAVCEFVTPKDDAGETLEDAVFVELTAAEPEFHRLEDARYDDVDLFVVDITGEEPVDLVSYTTGDNDTAVRFMSEDGTVIAEHDDSEDYNYSLYVPEVLPGRYLLEVSILGDYLDEMGYELTLYREGGGGGGLDPVHPRFSRYLEGSGGNNKFVEVGAPSTGSADLALCQIELFTNGSSSPSQTIPLNGILQPEETLLVCHTGITLQPGGPCQVQTSQLAFNGDDALALRCEGAIVDHIGQLGFDPGSEWTGGGVSTRDASLERRCDGLPADPYAPYDPSEHWQPLPTDDASALGTPWSCAD